MSRPLYQLKAEFFKTLGHPVRIRVLELLSIREHAVSELLGNAAKHGAAQRVSISLEYDDGLLRIVVIDDGRGGADAARGSGLRGIERRLGGFDGRLTLTSPIGGPTTATVEIPCLIDPEPSSPKTSTSSETA